MKTLLFALLLASPAVAQYAYPHHSFTFGLGTGVPRGDLEQSFNTKPALEVGYGYRLHRNFQIDVGLDTIFGAADTRRFVPSEVGDLLIRDYQFLAPFGARVILPGVDSRFQVSGGGGGAYMRYSERLRQPSDFFRFECPPCVSRDGWAVYALANASVAIDRGGIFRVGFTTKFYRGRTEGEAFGGISPGETKDRWMNLFGELSLNF